MSAAVYVLSGPGSVYLFCHRPRRGRPHTCCKCLATALFVRFLVMGQRLKFCLAPKAETPANLLRVDGRAARLVRSQQCYLAAEAREGMFPWNGQEDNMIDRFDGRALLDFYRDPDPRAQRPKTEEELELDAVRRSPCTSF